MQEVIQLLAGWGIVIPTEKLNWLAVALGVAFIAVAMTIGWIVSRLAGTHLSGAWERIAGERAEGLGPRMIRILYHAVVALLLAAIFFSLQWWTFTDLIIGFGWGVSAGYLVWHICRAVNFARWIAFGLGFFAFALVLINSVGGLERVTFIFDRIGVDVGHTRISLLTILSIAITGVALFALVRIIHRIVSHSINRATTLDATQKLLIDKLVTIAIMTAAFFIGIDILGIDLTALAFFGGALGLAVGFGMQKTVGNLIAGLILLMDRSIKPGDVIVVGDSFGWVNKIGVRAVSIITRDGKEHLIPNENLMTEEVENWSYSSLEVRVHIPIGVSYRCDIKLAQELMIEAATECKRVLNSPRPNLWMTGFGESSVDFELLVWIKDPEGGVGNVKSDIYNRVWTKFQDNDIEIPFPQRDIHVKEWPEGKPAALRDAVPGGGTAP